MTTLPEELQESGMPTEAPIITTIIPTYRRPLLLRRAIRSVLAQTYPHLRVCVYDNASGDETAAVVAELARSDARLYYHCHAENIGPTANFAYGIAQVQTPYFSFLSDDDYYLPTFYETAIAGFAAHPDAACSAAGSIVLTPSGRVTYRSSSDGYILPPDGLVECMEGRSPLIPGYVFRKAVIESVGSINSSIFYWDIDYLRRITARFPCVTSRKPSVIVILHEHQSTKGVDVRLAIQGYHAIQLGIQDDHAIPPDIRLRTQDALSRLFGSILFLLVGESALRGGDFVRAHEAAAALRTEFHMRAKAFALDLLATSCQRSRLVHWFVRTLLLISHDLFLRYRSWKYRAVRAEIADYLPTAAHAE